jgi:hypothetical protein
MSCPEERYKNTQKYSIPAHLTGKIAKNVMDLFIVSPLGTAHSCFFGKK